MTAGADLGEEAVCLAELLLALVLVTVLARQLGALDVDHRLEAQRARRPDELVGPHEGGFDLLAGHQALSGEQDTSQHDVSDELRPLLAPAQQRHALPAELDPALGVPETQVSLPADQQAPALRVGGAAALAGDRVGTID